MALLIVLTISAVIVQSPPSAGIRISLLRLHHHDDQISCDGRWEFIQLLDDGRTKINEDEVREEDLPSLIKKIMETRAERVVYVIPSSGIPYYRLVETISRLKNAVPDLHIALISGTLRDAYTSLIFAAAICPATSNGRLKNFETSFSFDQLRSVFL